MWCRITIQDGRFTLLDAEGDVDVSMTMFQDPTGGCIPTGKVIRFKGQDTRENKVEAEIKVTGPGA